MAEFIDKQKTLSDMIKSLGIKSKDYLLYAERKLYNVVEQAPAIDLTERSKGTWGRYSPCCSNCGVSKYNFISFNFDDPEGYAKPFGTWNFCPKCGADMRGQQE